ncbi:2-phospho-L-lactate guanylyltransferase [Geodermatophilus sp. CPCC 205761]|uniref:2-phospho-L-lactate guanylyltransferase n=1 Tax=Geodermatophilus sp. CPCC 205761 TaxID=2936597 RepID=UPI003EEF8934
MPLKRLDIAKSRLAGLRPLLRRRLVVAMARDVRDAVLACPEVDELVIVTRDSRWPELLHSERTRFVADLPTDSLNDALRRGVESSGSARSNRIAALPGDLPALQPAELQHALDIAGDTPNIFVPDARGDGTTLFTATSVVGFRPRYGERSRAAHRHTGAQELLLPALTGLRQDIDTMDDLSTVRALGLGAHTTAVTAAFMTATPRDSAKLPGQFRSSLSSTASTAELDEAPRAINQGRPDDAPRPSALSSTNARASSSGRSPVWREDHELEWQVRSPASSSGRASTDPV